eukprot:COSAG04_NODE_12_length_42844_cov_6.769213_22_plen_158_part_00
MAAPWGGMAALLLLPRAVEAPPPPIGYTGAVAQVPIAGELPLDQAQAFALGKMAEHAGAAKAQGAQIVVFSEGVMSHMWKTTTNNTAGCEVVPSQPGELLCGSGTAGSVVANASCIAKSTGLVLVFDMCDKQPCAGGSSAAPCPADGFYKFNTQVYR